MRPIVTTVTTGASNATAIALSQSLGAAGHLVINGSEASGGVATLDAVRRVAITSAGNDSGITWTVTGTARPEQGGVVQVETIQGANAGAATTTQDFATVASIASSGATASTVTAGTSNTASGPWVPWSQYAEDFQVTVYAAVMSGTPTWTLEYTYDDVFGTWLPAGVSFPRAIPLTAMTNKTTSADGTLAGPVRASRITLTAPGSVQLTQTQQGS